MLLHQTSASSLAHASSARVAAVAARCVSTPRTAHALASSALCCCGDAGRGLQQLRLPLAPARPLRGATTTAAAAQAGGGGGAAGGGSGGSSGSGSGGAGAGGSGAGDSSSSSPHPLRAWTWAYAAFLAAGGVFAYVKAGSRKSLTSALGAAAILALSGRKMLLTSARGSIAVCLAISVFLSVIMAGRYSRSRKVMPAGMTAAVSLGMSAAYILSLVA